MIRTTWLPLTIDAIHISNGRPIWECVAFSTADCTSGGTANQFRIVRKDWFGEAKLFLVFTIWPDKVFGARACAWLNANAIVLAWWQANRCNGIIIDFIGLSICYSGVYTKPMTLLTFTSEFIGPFKVF